MNTFLSNAQLLKEQHCCNRKAAVGLEDVKSCKERERAEECRIFELYPAPSLPINPSVVENSHSWD